MILEKTLRGIVIAGIFALPFICLVVATNLFFPYITGKNFAFRLIVEIMTGAWLALALVYPRYRPRRSWILGAFAIFVTLIAISDAQGVNVLKSFWSNYERMDGWVTLAHLLAYLVVAVSIMDTEKLWRRLFQLSLGISVFTAIYGLMQLAGITALGQGGAAGLSARVDARFGNPIYLAAYMLFHIFIAALLWVQGWNERRPGDRIPISILYGGVIALDTITLFFTGTRGTMLGLIGGALLSALLLVVFLRNSKTAWRIATGTIVFILAVSGAFWIVRDSTLVHSIGFLERLATISTEDRTIHARFINWNIAWQGVKERPILGWGQENYAIVFDKYYDPQMYNQEPWFDRVHDIIFDWWIAGGTLGLLAYLSIFAAILWVLWRSAVFSVIERSIVTGLLAGYFFHNLFVFDNITSYILFIAVIGYIAWRAAEAEKSPHIFKGGRLPENALPFAAAVCALLVWGAAWYVNAAALAENRTLLLALPRSQEGLAQSLDLFKKAVSYGTYGDQEAREQLAQSASQVAGLQIDASLKQAFFTTAVEQMKLQAQASPLDARFPLFLGIIYGSYGDHANAAKALERAHELSPKKQAILYSQAQNAQVQGDTAGALKFLETALGLAPENLQARLLYAEALIQAGQFGKADEVLAPIIATGEAADTRITAAYLAKGLYDKIAAIFEARIKAAPNEAQSYFTLAAAYYGAGEREKAIATLQNAASLFPSIKTQVDTLIEQIRSGTIKI